MPCQLMVGFFAYAKTLEISVDKDELEGTELRIGQTSYCFWTNLFSHCQPLLLARCSVAQEGGRQEGINFCRIQESSNNSCCQS